LNFLSLNLIVGKMLGGMLFVSIARNRKGPDLMVATWKLRAEFAQIAKNFGIKDGKRDITKEDWDKGSTTSKLFVPALMKLHIPPSDIPAMYEYMDMDGDGKVNVIEFLVMYRHIKLTQKDSMLTALIEMGKSTKERATYMLSNFDKPPSRDSVVGFVTQAVNDVATQEGFSRGQSAKF